MAERYLNDRSSQECKDLVQEFLDSGPRDLCGRLWVAEYKYEPGFGVINTRSGKSLWESVRPRHWGNLNPAEAQFVPPKPVRTAVQMGARTKRKAFR